MIRMSSNQFTFNYNLSLQKAYQRQTKLFEDADGGSLHRPSDDSVKYSKLLRYNDTLDENEQYQTNVKNGLSWMKSSDSAMVHISDIMKTLVTKSVQAANDDNNETDWDAIAREMEAEIQEIVSTANSQQGNSFLFSGQRDLIQPFNWEKASDGSLTIASRGLTKTLDNSQVNFFKNDGFKNIDTNSKLNQMLVLNHEGNTYYLDTESGYVYEKEFVEEGYKEIFNSGMRTKVDPTEDAVGRFYPTVNNDNDDSGGTEETEENTTTTPTYPVSVKDYFNNQGIIRQVDDVDEDNPVEDGEEVPKKPATIKILFFNNNGESTEAESTEEEVVDVNFSTIQQKIVKYAGNMEYFSMVKLNGAVQVESDTVNVNGKDLFGTDIFDNELSGNNPSGCAMINQLLTVLAKTEAHDNKWMTSDGITVSNVANSTMLVSETYLGARAQLYESSLSMLEVQNVNITDNITNISSTDVAELAVKLMEAQTLYSMSLSLGGRILPQSLADYL